MASGKQISFALGEVSPALRFRADANFYSQALYKASNCYIRKSGGASNRPGTLVLKDVYGDLICKNQDNIPVSNLDKIGVRVFPFTTPSGLKIIIELKDRILKTGVATWECPVSIASTIGEVSAWSTEGATKAWGDPYTKLDLSTACITQLNDSAVITVNDENDIYSPITLLIQYKRIGFDSGIEVTHRIPSPSALGTAGNLPATITGFGLDPKDIPVSYLITQEQDDGSEVFWQEAGYAGGHPHSQLSSTIVINATTYRGVKQYNIYRASQSTITGAVTIEDEDGNLVDSTGVVGVAPGHYSLVGRIPPSSDAASFRDYLVTPDITVQPPIDTYLYSPYIRKITYHKQRAIVVYPQIVIAGTEISDVRGTGKYKYLEGQIGASKIGSPKMFGRPLTPNPIDAFSFTIPSDKISMITQILSMDKLIVFTEYYTFVIRGGQNGVLTYSEVNPELIYNEGSTDKVEPVAVGKRGYFINSDRSKLLMISYDRDDAVLVSDISIYSDHLFEARDVRRLAVSNYAENILWILKEDGTLISVTISEEGSVLAYATHETDGFIEDIVIHKSTEGIYTNEGNYVTSLLLSVIRNGIRCYEKMAIRDDRSADKFLYADSAVTFGSLSNTDELTITSLTDFLGGSSLAVNSNGLFDADWKAIDFFFDKLDSYTGEYVTTKLRFYVDLYSNAGQILGHFEEDLPVELRDVETTSWLQAFDSITGLEHLAGKEVSVFADGQVISSPLNENYETLVVDVTGTLALDDFYNWGYVGLPYKTEIETLNLEAADARTFTDVGKLINVVGVGVNKTLGGFVGQTGITDLLDMEEFKTRTDEGIENTNVPYSGYLEMMIPSTWESTGRVKFVQVDPLPMSILAVYPKGVIGE